MPVPAWQNDRVAVYGPDGAPDPLVPSPVPVPVATVRQGRGHALRDMSAYCQQKVGAATGGWGASGAQSLQAASSRPPSLSPQTELRHQYCGPGRPDRLQVQQPPGPEKPILQVGRALSLHGGRLPRPLPRALPTGRLCRRYTGTTPSPPPGSHYTSPSENMWNAGSTYNLSSGMAVAGEQPACAWGGGGVRVLPWPAAGAGPSSSPALTSPSPCRNADRLRPEQCYCRRLQCGPQQPDSSR